MAKKHYLAFNRFQLHEIIGDNVVLNPCTGKFYHVQCLESKDNYLKLIPHDHYYGSLLATLQDLVDNYVFWNKDNLEWQPCGVDMNDARFFKKDLYGKALTGE